MCCRQHEQKIFLESKGKKQKCARWQTAFHKLKTRRKAAYRRIKKYYKSIKQYKKERLRRKLCWLLSGKYKETEIAEMLGISRRTVIRDMNKIKPYYCRLSRAYFSKLEQDSLKSRSQVEGWDQDSDLGSGFTGQ